MAAGPLFAREALTLPRQLRTFLMRSGYVLALLVLLWTANQATFGWQTYRSPDAMARFGALTFQLLSLVQLTLSLAAGFMLTAANIAQEKDRRTLILLLMTDLRNRELIGGKLFASLLPIGVLLLSSLPVFLLVSLLGGVMISQILWVIALCAVSAFAAGSWGSLVAFWREKTFQTLAIGFLGMLLLIGVIEVLLAFAGDSTLVSTLLISLHPYRALFGLLNPFAHATANGSLTISAWNSVIGLFALGLALDLIAIRFVRIWNPSRQVFIPVKQDNTETRDRTRKVWTMPIIWREMMTRAYGRKMLLIKLAYVAFSAALFMFVLYTPVESPLVLGMVSPQAALLVVVSLLSLMLINAQAVTSITQERDGQTLELLLVTDVTAKEFIFGKLGGALYNTREAVMIPILFAISLGLPIVMREAAYSFTPVMLLILGYLTLTAFSAMLGLHAGLSFFSSRTAITNSLGTMFFLFIGIFICMMLIVEAKSSFFLQLPSFLLFILVGGIGLWASLTHRNPSQALAWSAGLLPFMTFYAITSFLLQRPVEVLLAVLFSYGFTTIAMLIPSISEFDVALGRTSHDA